MGAGTHLACCPLIPLLINPTIVVVAAMVVVVVAPLPWWSG